MNDADVLDLRAERDRLATECERLQRELDENYELMAANNENNNPIRAENHRLEADTERECGRLREERDTARDQRIHAELERDDWKRRYIQGATEMAQCEHQRRNWIELEQLAAMRTDRTRAAFRRVVARARRLRRERDEARVALRHQATIRQWHLKKAWDAKRDTEAMYAEWLTGNNEVIDQMRAERDAALAENERQRGVLAWYGDSKNYSIHAGGGWVMKQPPVMADRGARAREALEGR